MCHPLLVLDLVDLPNEVFEKHTAPLTCCTQCILVFLQRSMCCTTQIETPYFSSECFDVICTYCGSSDNLLPCTHFVRLANLTQQNRVFLSASNNSLLCLVSHFYCLRFVL